MAFLMKITWSSNGPFRSFVSNGPQAGEKTTWGVIDRAGAGFRSAGDVKFFREGGLTVGDEGFLIERRGSKRIVAARLKIMDLGEELRDRWQPVYEVVARDFPNDDLAKLRAMDGRIDALPHFQKNAKGMMLRSFLPLDQADFDHFKEALDA
jgi:hypothetical protein